jgi:hypothetical protein
MIKKHWVQFSKMIKKNWVQFSKIIKKKIGLNLVKLLKKTLGWRRK